MKFLNKIIFSALLTSISLQISANQISAQQIEQFKQLPQAQQQALAKSMGVDLSALNLSGNISTSAQASPSLNELVPPRSEETFNPINDDVNIFDKRTNSNLSHPLDEYGNEGEQFVSQFAEVKVVNELKPFGYDLFAGEPSTFAPVSDVPVPAEYKLGPGDILNVQLYGKEATSYSLSINRQGNIDIPQLGPLTLSGLNFSEAKDYIKTTISERKIGVKSNVTMGELRSMRIFVLGEAYKPASYTLSSLSTVTQALYAAGGINEIGSLRNIQVKRKGQLITTLDLYDLLLRGDTSNDVQLMSSDVVFIPPVTNRIGVKGAVNRPAMYEQKNEKNVNELISLAGGVLSNSFNKMVKIERINENGLRSILSVNETEVNRTKTINGDVIEVLSALTTLEQSIALKGHVARPGSYGWQPDIRLSHLLNNIHAFKEQPDLSYILVTRKDPVSGMLTSHNVNYLPYISNNQLANDFKLMPSDTVYVFNKETTRSESLLPLLEKFKSQTNVGELPAVVSVHGAVRNPGEYPLSENETINSVLRAGMGNTLTAELSFVLLARKNNELQTSVIYVDLRKEEDGLIALQPLDRLFVFDKNEPREDILTELNEELATQATKLNSQQLVSISGDVRFVGQYPFVENMDTNQLIALAGGLNESSYLLEAEITRFEHDGIEKAKVTHQKIALQGHTFQLQPLDTLQIKRIPEWRERRSIILEGEVLFPGTYVLQKGELLRDVIKRAGGLTDEADATAAIFTRESLKKQEQEEIERISEELEEEANKLSLNAEGTSSDVSLEETGKLADKLKETSAVGRLVINLPKLLTKQSDFDIRVDNGDALYIPKQKQTITVMGEVQFSASHLFNDDLDLDDYINLAGGTKSRADLKRIYIIKADGSVALRNSSLWFGEQHQALAPGDTIVVPLDLEYSDNLTLWSTATQIMYQTATSIAVISNI